MADNAGVGGAADQIGGAADGAIGGGAADRSGKKAAVRRGGRPPRTVRGTGEKVRLHLAVSSECKKRLSVHCAMEDEDPNELVETLLMRHLLERGNRGFADAPADVAPKAWSPPPGAQALIEARRANGGKLPDRIGLTRPVSPDTTQDRQDSRSA